MSDTIEPARIEPPVARQPRWLILSLVVHVLLFAAYGVPELMHRLAERARLERARLEALARAEADRLAKEAAEAEARKQRLEDTKQEVIAELAKDFGELVAGSADEATLEESWSDLLAAMDDQLTNYAEALGDVTQSDAQLEQAFSNLKQEMVGKWQERLAARQMAEDFLARVRDQVVPQIADHFNAELDKRVYDPAKQAGAAVDAQMQKAVDSAFQDGFSKEAIPRLSGKLADQFGKDLGEAGLSDKKLVGEVGKAVSSLLSDAPKAMSARAGAPSGPEQGSSDKASGDKASGDKSSGGKSGGDKASGAISKASGEARAVGKDASGDEAFVASAKGGGRGSPSGARKGLSDRLASAAENAGRSLDDSSSSSSVSKMRQSATNRGKGHGNHGRAAIFHGAEHAKLTDGIHERDAEAAHGSEWKQEGAEGDASTAVASETIVKAAEVLMPPEKKDEPGKDEKPEPFKPAFKTINFAAIPFVRSPITVDGDLKEWTDLKALTVKRNGVVPGGMTAPETLDVKLAWDHTGFYFAYDIADVDKQITKVNADEFWNGDGSELFFDAPNGKDRYRGSAWVQQFYIWPFGSQSDENRVGGEAVKDDPSRGWSAKSYSTSDIARAAVKTEQGWRMEVHLPAKLIRRLELKAGRILGFNLSVCTGTTLDYYWAGTDNVTTSERPDTWGDILLAGSDGKLEAPDKLASELKPGDTAKNIRGLIIGEPLKLRVTDPDMNLSDEKKDKITVSVKSTDDYEALVLEETTLSSGIFEGAIATTLSLGEAVEKSLSLYEGEIVTATYTDQARGDGSRKVEVVLPITCGAGANDVAEAH